MREIKFRGQRINSGNWLYGSLISPETTAWIVIEKFISYQVTPATVGQYIRIKDKNKVEIYEGDIIKWDDGSNGKYWRVAKVVINPDIQFQIVKNTLYPLSTPYPDTFHFGSFIYADGKHLEVIGNIHENANLLL